MTNYIIAFAIVVIGIIISHQGGKIRHTQYLKKR